MAIEPFEDAEACGKRGHFNGRCSITKGMNRYANLAQFVNRGDCLALKSDQLDDQVSLKAYCRCIGQSHLVNVHRFILSSGG